jgi:hypothetical protein
MTHTERRKVEFNTCLMRVRIKLYGKKYRQCTYNVTLKRFIATIVTLEKINVLHILSVCFCSLVYPVCNARAPYCRLLPAPFYNIFPHYHVKGTIVEKKILLTTKCVLVFSTTCG